MNKYKSSLIIVSVLMIILGTWTYINAEGGTISVCAGTTGTMYMVGSGFKKTTCSKGEQLISWNIQGVKGDKGDTGEQGPQGLKGDKGDIGERGPAGLALHLFDANGQDLGIIFDIEPLSLSNVTTFISSPGIFLQLRQSSQSITVANMDAVWFTGANCTGTPYGRGGNPGGTIVNPSVGRAFRYVTGSPLSDDSAFGSRLAGDCANNQGGPGLGFPMEEVLLPFSFPLALPLHVSEN